MTSREAAFALQEPLYLVEEYIEMIRESGLDDKKVYDRLDGRMGTHHNKSKSAPARENCQDERREQEQPIAG
jgi:hypothetical protein